MKKQLSFVWALVCLLSASFSFAQSPVGTWRTIDDETGKEKSVVEIFDYQGKITAKVKQITDASAKKICDACSGDKKNKPIEGMTILWGMAKKNNEWSGGYILDPKNGKVYTCKIWMEGKNLKVRGYIGPFFRTQTWYPAK